MPSVPFFKGSDPSVLDITDLRVFVRITDAGSISGAARALGMPKSSVSRSLVRIESAVGATLVERSTRRLALTDAGLLLQRHARRILDDVGEAEDALAGSLEALQRATELDGGAALAARAQRERVRLQLN